MASALDGDRQGTLVLGTRAGLAAWLNLRTIRHHPPQPLYILVIGDDLISGELIDLPAREKTPTATATAAPEATTATRAITTRATSATGASRTAWAIPEATATTGTTGAITEATAATATETTTGTIAETTATLPLIVNHLSLLVGVGGRRPVVSRTSLPIRTPTTQATS
jgi:hypothetical protein